MKCGSFNGGDDGEHKGLSFVEISKIFAVLDTFFSGPDSFDRE